MSPLPSTSPDLRDAGSNSFLHRHVQVLGISLGEMDYLRGWKDDFLGDQLADQYTSATNGVGSFVALLDAVHGGAATLTSGAGVGSYAQLWLGDAADNYDSLNANSGWAMAVYMSLSASTNITAYLGTSNAGINRYILAGADTAVGGNWYLWCRDGALPAGLTTVDSTIAIDTDYHWHVIEANSTDEVNYYLDGAPIATCTTNIPGTTRTPLVECYSPADSLRNVELNCWLAIPR